MEEFKQCCINNEYINEIKSLANNLNSYVETGVNCRNELYVYIYGVVLKDGLSSTGISGIGYTFAEACRDYYNQLSNVNVGYWLQCSNVMFEVMRKVK